MNSSQDRQSQSRAMCYSFLLSVIMTAYVILAFTLRATQSHLLYMMRPVFAFT